MASPKDVVGYVELALNLREYFTAMKSTLGQLAKEIDDVKVQTLLLKEQFSTLQHQVQSQDTAERVQVLATQSAVISSELSSLQAQVERDRSTEQLTTLDKQLAVMYNEVSNLRDRVSGLESSRRTRAAEPARAAPHRLPDSDRRDTSMPE